jgi:hypothetical protein
MVTVAVDGEPDTIAEVPMLVPSMEKITVPVGSEVPGDVAVRVAVIASAVPPAGVVVAGIIASAVGLLGTVMVTDVAVDVA